MNYSKQFIIEQLQYFHYSKRVLDTWIIAAADVLDSIILKNEIYIHNLPQVQQTTLYASTKEEVVKHWDKSKTR